MTNLNGDKFFLLYCRLYEEKRHPFWYIEVCKHPCCSKISEDFCLPIWLILCCDYFSKKKLWKIIQAPTWIHRWAIFSHHTDSSIFFHSFRYLLSGDKSCRISVWSWLGLKDLEDLLSSFPTGILSGAHVRFFLDFWHSRAIERSQVSLYAVTSSCGSKEAFLLVIWLLPLQNRVLRQQRILRRLEFNVSSRP